MLGVALRTPDERFRLRIHVGVLNIADRRHWDWADVRGRPAPTRHWMVHAPRPHSGGKRQTGWVTLMNKLVALCALGFAFLFQTAMADQPPRYTFSWPLSENAPAPRGGTTRGPKLELDRSESKEWRALREPGISDFERDRRAILAMAGEYRVTFDFLEVVPFKADGARDRPYQSWGTERVYVDRDEGRFISLSHILEMRILKDDGSVSEPIVTKHWRQDWRYEPTQIVEYNGRDQWVRRSINRKDARGQWSQAVYQVDESPRYASIGRWEHTPSFSTWISAETWRPLPRREWSVRKDYHVLIGTNRHTITPTGWVQEENNLKAVLTAQRTIDPAQPYLSREYGVARYERLLNPDFAAADRYYERTRQFWGDVRNAWADLFARNERVTLVAPVDQAGLFRQLFEHAQTLAEGKTPAEPSDKVIQDSLRKMGALPQVTQSERAPEEKVERFLSALLEPRSQIDGAE
jgi:hypothetical protein